MVQEQNEEWRRTGVDLNAVVNVKRSFSDVSSGAVFVDAVKMVGGYLLMFAYTTIFLSVKEAFLFEPLFPSSPDFSETCEQKRLDLSKIHVYS